MEYPLHNRCIQPFELSRLDTISSPLDLTPYTMDLLLDETPVIVYWTDTNKNKDD